MTRIISSPISPFLDASSLSIPQLMSRYNPDGVESVKIVHTDGVSDEPVRYGSLRTRSGQAAWGLRHQLGLQEGDTVLALVSNSNDFIYLAHATWWAGAIFAPMNPQSPTSDIAYIIKLVRPTHIATVEAKLGSVQEALSTLKGKSPKIFTVLSSVEGFLRFPDDFMTPNTLPPFDLGVRHARDVTSTICFSSGTTGRIKGVQLSHHNIVMNILQMRTALPSNLNSEVCEVWFLPYFHIYGLALAVLAGMWVGARYESLTPFDFTTFYRKAVELNVTNMHIVPPVALALASASAPALKVPALRHILIAAAPLKKAVQLQLKQKFPEATICQGYGLSECSPAVLNQYGSDAHGIGSVGKALPGTELRIVDPETRKDVPPGEEGELWVRGPQVMMGYLNNEAATKETFVDDWLRTGDILKVDEHGNFWVMDRMKEMIKYKGFQIAPSEMEDLLLNHPDVVDAAVCATYDDAQATEVPLAYVSLSPDKANLPSREKEKVLKGIQEWTDRQVSGYKRLRGGVFHLQSIPKSATGKILRRQLPKKLTEKRVSEL